MLWRWLSPVCPMVFGTLPTPWHVARAQASEWIEPLARSVCVNSCRSLSSVRGNGIRFEPVRFLLGVLAGRCVGCCLGHCCRHSLVGPACVTLGGAGGGVFQGAENRRRTQATNHLSEEGVYGSRLPSNGKRRYRKQTKQMQETCTRCLFDCRNGFIKHRTCRV